MSATLAPSTEQRETFACFGSRCTVIVADALAHEAAAAVIVARRRLLEWHDQFSRFSPDSELARLNEDPAETVAVQSDNAARRRGRDPGCGGDRRPRRSDSARSDRTRRIRRALRPARPPAARRARASAGAPSGPTVAAESWRHVRTDRRTSSVTRPPGVRIDPGGIAKGVFADELAAVLSSTRRSSSNAPAIFGWAEGSRLRARCTWRARSTTGSSTRFSGAPAASLRVASASAAGSGPTERLPTTCSIRPPVCPPTRASSRSRRSRRRRWRRRRSARRRS